MANTGSEKTPMTVTGKLKLENELKRLLTEERPSVIKAIEEARAQGDISENAEYDAAKERQAIVEGRINEIQAKLISAEVVDPATIKSDKVMFGATVTLRDLDEDQKVVFQIVGVDEADVKAGKISVMSPLARALINKKKGEISLVQGPKFEKEYEILKIEYK